MSPRPGTQCAQITTGGLGKHFESPRCPRDKRKTQKLVEIAGQSSKCHRLAARLEQLQSEAVSSPSPIDEADHFDDELAY